MEGSFMGKSISHCQGKGSLAHNNREFKAKNVNVARSKENITFIKQNIGAAYEMCFKSAVERYNDKQTRNDRKITATYYEHLFHSKPSSNVITSSDKRKSFYEDLVQIGTKDDTGVGTLDGKAAAECLTEYMNGFQKRNPNFYVFNAVLHMDEVTPHLHIDYIPIGHYKRGIDTQNGLAQALKEMGFGTGKDAINRWRIAERKILTKICAKNNIEISEPEKSRGYSFAVEEYKEYKNNITKLQKQSNTLENNIESKNKEFNEIQEKINIIESRLSFVKETVISVEEVEKSGRKKFNGSYVFTASETEALKSTAKNYYSIVSECNKAEQEIKMLNIYLEGYRNQSKQFDKFLYENQRLKSTLKEINQVLNSNPVLKEMFNQQKKNNNIVTNQHKQL